MAVEDKYVSTALAAGKIEMAARSVGASVIGMVATGELAAGDSATSVYRFFKGLSGNLIPIDIKVYWDDAITDETDADIGLYEQGVGGVVIDADVFADAIDFTLAGGAIRGGGDVGDINITDEAADGLKNVGIANLTKKIYEHAGHTIKNAKSGYDICLTLNTGVTTTGGTVTMIATFLQGS